jgi:CRISPR-associated endonuclease Cas2
MKTFVIAYDIFNLKRLKKVKKIAYSYALGGQKSALEAPLDKTLMNSLLKELEGILEDEDKVNIIKVSKPIVLGKGVTLEYKNGVIIV